MSDDWIPVPEIENVVIIIAELGDTLESIQEAPAFAMLQRLVGWHGGSVYVFHDPPEAGEILEDASPEMAAQFALAAQMSDAISDVCRDAFRRVFSRATVKRSVLIHDRGGVTTPEEIAALLEQLKQVDAVFGGSLKDRFALGMTSYQAEIFSDADFAAVDLMKEMEAVATANARSFGPAANF